MNTGLPEAIAIIAGRCRSTGEAIRTTLAAVAIGFATFASTTGALAVPSEGLKFYDDAVTRLEREDIAGAIIQLNNAIQKDPSLLAAHVLLGKTRLRNGDPAGAETSFIQALRLGVDRAEVAVPLAQAYIAQRKFDALLERVTPAGLPLQARIDVLTLRGHAFGEKDNGVEALRSFYEAQALDPNSIGIRLAMANMLMRTDQLAKAIAVTDEAAKLAPQDPAVWNMRGLLMQTKGDLNAALRDYQKTIALDPKNIDALIAEASLLFELGRQKDGDKALANLSEVAPRDPRVAYLRAVVARQNNDPDAVRKELSSVIAMVDKLPRESLNRRRELMLMGGLAHLGLGNQEKAAQYLSLYVKANPKQLGPAKILASIYLDRGDPGRAIAVLAPLEVAVPDDAQVLTLLAAAHMAEQRFVQATRLLERAVQISGGAPDARVNLGVMLIAGGQADVGFSQLQQAFIKDPSQARAGIVMATLQLKREQPQKAVEVIDVVVKQDPKNLDALNLQGIAHVTAGDRVGGRAAYEKALAIDPGFYPARLNNARLDITEGRLDVAANALSELLNKNPKDGEAMIEFARLEERAGRIAEAKKWLDSAMTVPGQRVMAELALSGLLMRQREFERAVVVAKTASGRSPSDVNVSFALARAQIAYDDKTSARETLSAMAPLAGFNPAYNLEIARLQVTAGDREGAYKSLDKSIEGSSDNLSALIMLTEMAIGDQNYAKAEQSAKRIVEKFPTRGVGYRLTGDIATARGQTNAAITAYRSSLAKEKLGFTAIHLYDAMVIANGRTKALAFLQQWHRDNPNDSLVLRALADGRAAAGELAAARTDYDRLLQSRPNDVEVLNNAAQVALRQQDAAALGYAERAYQLASTRAAVLDTFGWVLVRHGQLERGTTMLREARLRDSANPEIRYHLATALAMSGRDAEARSELKESLKEGVAYEGIEEARLLQRKLGP